MMQINKVPLRKSGLSALECPLSRWAGESATMPFIE